MPPLREQERYGGRQAVQMDPEPSWQRGYTYSVQDLTSPRDTVRSLTLQGLTLLSHSSDLLTATLNVNGLTLPKLTELLWYMACRAIDVLFLIDTRCGTRESSRLCRHARSVLGVGSGAYACAAQGAACSRRHTCSRAGLVGGQIALLTPRWATRCIRVIEDPTHLGVLFGVLLSGLQGPIQILGTYWPCPPPSATDDHMGLHSKLQQWLHRLHINMAPMDYLRGLVRGRVLRHLSHITDTAPHPISLVLGDFNASWNGLSGPHKGLSSWAATTGLLNPFAYAAHISPFSVASFYSGLRPVGLIDHIFLSQSYPGLVSLTALDDGSFWSTISDHRPILLGLSSPALQVRRLGRPVTRPNWPKTEVPSQPPLLRQYQAQLVDRPLMPITDTSSSAEYLFQVCVDTAAIAASLSPPSANKGKRWKDGWSPPMMCLKANLEALWQIWGHLRGTGGRHIWKSQADMDTNLEQILAPWERVVHYHYRDDPAAYHAILARGGYPPSYWRTLDTLVLESIHLVKGQLHGRNRNYLRMLINAQVYRRETSRLKGKLGRVIRSILHEEVQFYPIETLRVAPDSILTDGSQIHNAVTAHFEEWYRAPPSPDHVEAWWVQKDRQAFIEVGRQAAIPDPLLQILWTGLLHVPRRPAVVAELEMILSSPPSFADFQLAIANIRRSTSPGASGLTYGMIKHWPESLVTSVYQHLASLFFFFEKIVSGLITKKSTTHYENQ